MVSDSNTVAGNIMTWLEDDTSRVVVKKPAQTAITILRTIRNVLFSNQYPFARRLCH